jgi:hypothetical protein
MDSAALTMLIKIGLGLMQLGFQTLRLVIASVVAALAVLGAKLVE